MTENIENDNLESKEDKKIIREHYVINFKQILNILSLITAVISILIAGKSCYVSESSREIAEQALKASVDSNKIANNALDTTKNNFLEKNKPYVLLKIKKNDEGDYWRISLKGSSVIIEFKYEMKNVGNVVAKNITLPENLRIKNINRKSGAKNKYHRPGPISLGPNDFYFIGTKTLMAFDTPEKAQKYIDGLRSEDSKGVVYGFSVVYEHELEPSYIYRTLVKDLIHNDQVIILKSEMSIVSKDSGKTEIENSKQTP